MPDPTKEDRDRIRAWLQSGEPSGVVLALSDLRRYADYFLDAADERDRLRRHALSPEERAELARLVRLEARRWEDVCGSIERAAALEALAKKLSEE